MKFKEWLINRDKEEANVSIPDAAIKVHLPSVKQQTKYSCGAAAFRSIADYFRIRKDEKEWMKLLETSTKGTEHDNLVKIAKGCGMQVECREGMTVEDLCTHLDNKVPVICAMQAWGAKEYYKKGQSGHYVVAIGYDNNNIYFEDPTIAGKRGFLNKKEFNRRWHDKDVNGNKVKKLGVAMWKGTAEPHKKIAKAKKIN